VRYLYFFKARIKSATGKSKIKVVGNSVIKDVRCGIEIAGRLS